MFHSLHWSERASVKDLPALKQQLYRHGGEIVQYQCIMSAIFFARTTNYLEWVPPYSSRFSVGLKYVLQSLLLGWWSLPGLLFTPPIIINDLLGGADVTDLYVGPPPPPPAQRGEVARRELDKLTSRGHWVILATVVLLLVAIFLLLALSPSL